MQIEARLRRQTKIAQEMGLIPKPPPPPVMLKSGPIIHAKLKLLRTIWGK